MHYKPEGGNWTNVPGTPLSTSDYPGYFKIILSLNATKISLAAFNNGNGVWDNNNGIDYSFDQGITTVTAGVQYVGTPQISNISTDSSTLQVSLGQSKSIKVYANYVDGTKVDISGLTTLTPDIWQYVDVLPASTLKGLVIGTTPVLVRYYSFTTTVNVNVTAVPATQATDRSITSLYLSNWKDTMGIWMNSRISQLDQGGFSGGNGPRLAELHYKDDMSTSVIKEYTGFFRNETSGVKYNNVTNFNAEAYYDENGILNTKYLNYGASSMPITVKKDYSMVPNQNFTIATYTFTNPTGSPIEYNLLEMIHLNNKTQGNSNKWHHGWYDSSRRTIFVDMTGAGQAVVAMTAFEDPSSFTVADDLNTNSNDLGVSPWIAFDRNATLKNNVDKWALDMSVAFQTRFVIPANGSIQRSFAISMNSSTSLTTSAVDTLRTKTAEEWLNTTRSTYTNWLTAPGKKQVSFSDEGMNLTYKRNLVAIKNAINPLNGAMPATTNPYNYSYKVWARDSAVTAIILDKAGFREEAHKYWYFLRDRVRDDGTIGTCFNLWTGNWVQFVEPEHDAIGLWIYGAYNHYKLSGYDATFLNDMWGKMKKSADFISNTMNSWGYSSADSSIWEENIEYNTFTQATYIAGMTAAQSAARAKGLTDMADWWNGVSGAIRTSLQRNDWDNKGMWNSGGGYYNRAVYPNGTINTKLDSSSDLLMVLGIIDSNSSRAVSHISKIKSNLLHDGYGIARYDGDIFYYTSPWSPAGDEAKSDEPSWPQMSMYVALHHIYRGEKDEALKYLQWYVSRTALGYMAAGEAVSRIDMRPLVSTALQPVTAAWYIITALAYTNQEDMKVIPYQYNAGMNKSITVNGALSQWNNVPYNLDELNDSTNSNLDIARVYVSNDAQNLYVRVKTQTANTLSGNVKLKIYAEDFKASTASKKVTSTSGATLDHGAAYLLEVANDGNIANKYVVNSNAWTLERIVQNSSTLRYDAVNGEYIASFPLWSLSSNGSYSLNDWSNMNITLEHSENNAWIQDDTLAMHYRYTTSETPIYGNVE